MRKEDFKRVLIEWKDFTFPEFIERENKLPISSSNIISLVGVRRCGKTFLLLSLAKKLLEKLPRENVIYINFEHELLRSLRVEDMDDLFEAYAELFESEGKKLRYLLLDEIQVVPYWEKWVRRVYDQRKYFIYITGSSSKLLPKELASALRGRTINYRLYPLAFKEFLRYKKFEIDFKNIEYHAEKKGKMIKLLHEYIEFGGFPDVVLKKEINEKIKLFDSYFDTILYRDIIERFGIKETGLLEEFIRYIINNFSSYFSVTKTENFFKSQGKKCSKSTLSNFLKYINAAFVAYPVELFSYKIKDRLQYPTKVYLIDTGLINFTNPRFNQNIGKLMENVCYLQLLRKKESDPRLEFFYWKVYGEREREVDFVVKSGTKIQELLQVTYSKEKKDIQERELKSLLKASSEIKCNNLTVITWEHESEEKIKGKKIKYIPLWKWLLS